MSYFLQKTTKINVFSVKFFKNPRKTQGPFNLKALRKNPRTQDCFGKPKILGENPSSGNAGWQTIFYCFKDVLSLVVERHCIRQGLSTATQHSNYKMKVQLECSSKYIC